MPRLLPLLCIFFMLTSACSGGDDTTATPRRRAYPRLSIQADTMGLPVDLAGVELRINRATTFNPDAGHPGWANVEYPQSLGATLHLSLTRPETMPQAVANRRQRIALNLGDAPALSEEFINSGGWACTLVWSQRAGLTTPVQILATSPDGRLLSGAVALERPGENSDSIHPLLELLRSDARTLLLNLR